MRFVIFLLILAVLPLYGMSSPRRRKGEDQHLSKSGGWFSSPNYPNLFEKNSVHSYFINAPTNHAIVIKFHEFILKEPKRGRRRDVLRIIDGKRTDPVNTKFFWGKLRPFTYSSTTNKLLLIFKSHHQYPKKGFNATFYFVNKATHCDSTSLNTDLSEVTSCDNKVGVFATQCRVQCKRNTSEQVADCVNGEFTNVDCTEYCDQSSLQVSNGSVTSCKISNGRASECKVTCDQHFTGGGVAVCRNQVFAAKKCIAKSDLVKQCEATNMVVCPYTTEDIMNFYSLKKFNNQSESNGGNGATATASPTFHLVRDFKIGTCPQYACDKKFFVNSKVFEYKFKCTTYKNFYKWFQCFYCRHFMNCKRRTKSSALR